MNGQRSDSDYLLATDLDGTLIPLEGSQQNHEDLTEIVRLLDETNGDLVFVTGRHHESVCQAISTTPLPTPRWMICDVGSSVYEQGPSGEFQMATEYANHLSVLTHELPASRLTERLQGIAGLRAQPSVQQGEYKSSWFCDRDEMSDLVERIQMMLTENDIHYGVISSVDPLTDEGLIDLLPQGVTKAYALQWLITKLGHAKKDVIFSGDSGNDLAALTAGYRAILVSNATGTVREEAIAYHQSHGTTDLFFESEHQATSGVVDGLRHHLQRLR